MKSLPDSVEQLQVLVGQLLEDNQTLRLQVESLKSNLVELRRDHQELRQENKELRQENKRLKQENKDLNLELDDLKLLLKKYKNDPPPQIKPSVKKETRVEEKEPAKHKERKQRSKPEVRKRSSNPDQLVYHAQHDCPDCLVAITGNSIAYHREVIEIPPVTAITTKHIILKRKCWQCGRTWTPKVDWSQYVVGQSRFGVRLTSLVNTMTEHLRQPITAVQSHLNWVYGLHLSQGSIVDLRHRVAHAGAGCHRDLRRIIRGSPMINADETSHREDGVNSYTWSYSTPKTRYFLYGRGRDAGQVKEVLGDEFEGVLVTDYYAAYNSYDGQHQRCWAHLLRDIDKVVKLYEDDPERETILGELESLQTDILQLFNTGKLIQQSQLDTSQRHQIRREFENSLLELVIPYRDKEQKKHPFHKLAKRIDKYLDEHFTYLLSPEIPATNNAAERAVRHSVISRKISGGTRSKSGTRTKEILSSLFGTWHVRGLNPLEECRKLLTDPNYSIAES